MRFHDAFVYVNGLSVASTAWDNVDERLFSEVAFTRPRGKIRVREADCTHPSKVRGYVYVDWLDEHWPVEFCDDCFTILRGRDRRVSYTSKPLWEQTDADAAHDLGAHHWNDAWPRVGRPRRVRPTDFAWPDAA